MIGAERRRIALGIVASLALHVVAIAALEIRRTDHVVVAAAEETVLEVTLWAGADGQAGGVASSTPGAEALLVEADPTPSAAQPAPLRDERAVDRPESTAEIAPAPPEPHVERPRSARTSEPHGDGPSTRVRSIVRRSPSARRAHAGERPHRRVPATGATPTTGASAESGRPGAPGSPKGGGSASDLAAYLARVRARIASRQPAVGGEQGRVGIRFEVADDGSFSGLTAVSGDRGPLVDAALRIVRRASPAPPIPPALGRGTIAMTLTIVFD